jgi:heterotetrameric sarcosine oxidase delta subunit
MSFLVPCPNCGERDVHEFRHGGEISSLSQRKTASDSDSDLVNYFYYAKNVAGEQKEWWYHTFGCRKWFVGYRNTVTNDVLRTEWPKKTPNQ